MSPQTRKNWIDTGLEILGAEGVSAITIDRMTDALGVTKGAFYHHFKNIQQFKLRLLEAWTGDSVEIIRTIEQNESPEKVLFGLIDEFEKRSPLPEIAIRAWAVSDPLPREHMERLDAVRVAFLTDVFTRIFKSRPKAETAARMLYCIITGSLAVHPPLEMTWLKKIFRELFRLHGIGIPGRSSPAKKGDRP
jgi:AcrR family transcriptional regulator